MGPCAVDWVVGKDHFPGRILSRRRLQSIREIGPSATGIHRQRDEEYVALGERVNHAVIPHNRRSEVDDLAHALVVTSGDQVEVLLQKVVQVGVTGNVRTPFRRTVTIPEIAGM